MSRTCVERIVYTNGVAGVAPQRRLPIPLQTWRTPDPSAASLDASDTQPSGSVFDAGGQPSLAPSMDPPPVSAAGTPPTAAGVPSDFVHSEIGGYKLGAAIPAGATDVQLNAERSEPTGWSWSGSALTR